MLEIILSFGIISVGLLIGMWIKRLENQSKINPFISLELLFKRMIKIVMLGLNPVIFIGAFWMIQLEDTKIVMLPLLGIFSIIFGGVLALWFSKLLKLDRPQTGAMFVSGSFSNMASFGTLFCFMLLGEASLVFVAMFKLLEEFIYYIIGFPVAKTYGMAEVAPDRRKKWFVKLLTDPFILAAFTAILVGGSLSLSPWERPDFYSGLNTVLVILATILLIVPIGYRMRIRAIRGYFKESMSISVIKFVAVPLSVTSVAILLGLGNLSDGLVLKVIIIMSALPPAFASLVPPQLYQLDVDLANSSWLFNTGMTVVVLPLLYLIVVIWL